MTRKALGRGLDALIPSTPVISNPGIQENIQRVSLSKIRPNRLQPRKHFNPEKLAELAASIKEHGLAQPIVVSYDSGSDTYELIAGERRLRASELAGYKDVEVVVRKPDSDKSRLALALIENLQREDLNAIEEALGYLRLMKEFSLSQTEVSQVVGKSKAAVSNTLRLLDLPDEIQKAIQFEQLTEGHARALLMLDNAAARHRLFQLVLEQKLSVRQTEDLARQAQAGEPLEEKKPERVKAEKPADVRTLESSLEHLLGTKVEVKTKKDPTKGAITIHFFTLDDLDRILKVLKK
jgi:ParB family transcriptional regulator, chromosome partitioning protein